MPREYPPRSFPPRKTWVDRLLHVPVNSRGVEERVAIIPVQTMRRVPLSRFLYDHGAHIQLIDMGLNQKDRYVAEITHCSTYAAATGPTLHDALSALCTAMNVHLASQLIRVFLDEHTKIQMPDGHIRNAVEPVTVTEIEADAVRREKGLNEHVTD